MYLNDKEYYQKLEKMIRNMILIDPVEAAKKKNRKEMVKKECYHQWRYFNKWCQECGEFGHGVIVSHCFKCSKMWDRENGFWTQEDINNVFFNEHFQTKK